MYFFAGGTYNNKTTLTQESDCADCQVGTYCPQGSTNPIDCPAGFYCASQKQVSGAQTPCPTGTYSNATGLTGKLIYQHLDLPLEQLFDFRNFQ